MIAGSSSPRVEPASAGGGRTPPPAECSLVVGDRVKFVEEKQAYTVQAMTQDGRWVVATKPFNPRRTVLYTLIDTVERKRGVDNSIGNSLGYETREDCEAAMSRFDSEPGGWGFSRRHPPLDLNIESINGQVAS